MKLNASKRLFILTGMSLALWACEQQSNTSDFFVRDEHIQQVDLADIDKLILRCHCSGALKFGTTQIDAAQHNITGTYSSVGYHGDQEKPVSISDQLLAFKETRYGTTLILESQEYTFIHHAFLIEKLEIQMPRNVNFQFDVLNYEELVGRKVK